MLTISKPLSAGQAQTYHQKEFTAKEQNYWWQQGHRPRMAKATGRAVRPCRDRFCRGLRETQPGPTSTDGQLVRQRALTQDRLLAQRSLPEP